MREKNKRCEFIVFFDLDGTMWTHLDVSAMKPPFNPVGEGMIMDSSGEELRLYQEMVELVKYVRELGGLTSTLSWNRQSHALSALKTLGIDGLFDYHAIKPTPDKYSYMQEVLEKIEQECGRRIPPGCIVYIDDREIHLEEILENIGEIIFIRADKCRNDTAKCRETIKAIADKCRGIRD